MALNIHPFPSANFNERNPDKKISLIILHYTDMLNAQSALDLLCRKESNVSAHYLISDDGRIYQLVNNSNRAWHAGVGFWQGETDINSISIGIELDNPGHTNGLKDYPEKQLLSLVSLLSNLCTEFNISKECVLGHSDIAPTRKRDPGEHFPWGWLQQQGFGIKLAKTLQRPISTLLTDVQLTLGSIGYYCPQTKDLDDHTRAVITAFQRHFTPKEITGTISPSLCETLSRVIIPVSLMDVNVSFNQNG